MEALVVYSRTLLALLALVWLAACGDPQTKSGQEGTQDKKLARLSPEERKRVAPNSMFEAVYEGELKLTQELLIAQPELLSTVNEESGDRPLAVAIRLQETEIGAQLAAHIPPQDLFYQNQDGEGYLFLASKYGQVAVIDVLADRYWSDVSDRYWGDFEEIDMPNLKGQRALHVAADANVAERLKYYWRKAYVKMPYQKMARATDINGQSFLHTAAADGRISVLEWGKSRFCKAPHAHSEDEGWWDKIKGWVGYGLRVMQVYAPGRSEDDWIKVKLRNHFNWIDMEDQSPLHEAVESKNKDAVISILGCEWVDPQIKDQNGLTPLALHISNLPSSEAQTTKEDKVIFERLAHHRQKGRLWRSTPSYLNQQDKVGETALHKAALLADRYYYDQLVELGADPYIRNNQGMTPQQAFDETRRRKGTLVR